MRQTGAWRRALALALGLAAPAGCTPPATVPSGAGSPGIARYGRPPGMPIGTGANAGNSPAEEADGPPPPEVTGTRLAIPSFERPVQPPPAPCSGCVELSLYLNDINQRDEFAFDAGGVPVTRIVWTLLVTLNSDQLAVQPFVNDRKGEYTEIDANTFPLGKPVELVHEFKGKARTIGLIVASSGAWTGDQRVSVYVDAVRADGPRGLGKSFDADAEGFAPRTHAREPALVFHGAEPSPP